VLMELFTLDVAAEALRAKLDRKSAISLHRGHSLLLEISGRRGRPPSVSFFMDSWANECVTTLSLTVVTQRNFVADFLRAKWKT